jgi:dihydrofolate reductase
MRKVIVNEWMSLDGVVQSPIYPDEDASGGFRHGGWHKRYLEEVAMKWAVANIAGAGGFLFGRRTYDVFAAHWPKAATEEQPLARPLNQLPKYVASRTLVEPLAWEHARLLRGDVGEAVAALKREPGGDLLLIGSTQLACTLLERGLVDELRLMIDPILLGGGKRYFPDDGALRRFRLTDSQATATGVLIVTYAVMP